MSIHPRYWPTWLALGVLRVFEPLPFPLLVWLGRRVGGVTIGGRAPLRIQVRRLHLMLPVDPAHHLVLSAEPQDLDLLDGELGGPRRGGLVREFSSLHESSYIDRTPVELASFDPNPTRA